ncbi:hypothetical protein LguiB_004654 [Lonicera macranthoides]
MSSRILGVMGLVSRGRITGMAWLIPSSGLTELWLTPAGASNFLKRWLLTFLAPTPITVLWLLIPKDGLPWCSRCPPLSLTTLCNFSSFLLTFVT